MPRRIHQWDSAADRYNAAIVALTAWTRRRRNQCGRRRFLRRRVRANTGIVRCSRFRSAFTGGPMTVAG